MFFPSTLTNHFYNAHTGQHILTFPIPFAIFIFLSFSRNNWEIDEVIVSGLLLGSPVSCFGGI